MVNIFVTAFKTHILHFARRQLCESLLLTSHCKPKRAKLDPGPYTRPRSSSPVPYPAAWGFVDPGYACSSCACVLWV